MRNRELKIILLVFILIVIGLFSIYSATISRLLGKNLSPFLFVERQLIAFIIGLILFFLILSFPYRALERSWFFIYLINLILLIGVFFFGRETLGAQRWYSIFGFSFQPSELSKLFIILSLSGYFCETKKKKGELGITEFFFASLLLFLTALAIFLQPDLGTAIIIALTGLFLVFISGIPKRYIIKTIMAFILLIPFFWFILKPYQQQRIITFLNPYKDPLGSGYQVLQGLIAIGSGRVLGKGWLGGQQTHLNLIPEQHTDFIFTVIGEEFGFIGGVILLLIYYLLFYYLWKIYININENFGKMIVGGILFSWLIQTFINIGMVLGLLPVVGVPLPFVSFARSSLITNLMMLGFLVNISIRSDRMLHV
ncbi:MAG: rod shape-determining protein RodA [Dictyoglomus sp.]|nr:rod shape-determining protein RodA [Dictyoglomus sp.]MDW8188450.1 rod shape-determining protein RodA [Dictyoglomus sp.]